MYFVGMHSIDVPGMHAWCVIMCADPPPPAIFVWTMLQKPQSLPQYCKARLSGAVVVRFNSQQEKTDKIYINNTGLKRRGPESLICSCPMITVSASDNLRTRLEKLGLVTTPDGVNYTNVGYETFVKNCITCFSLLDTREALIARAVCPSPHYWRGFRGAVGALAHMVTASCGPLSKSRTTTSGPGGWLRRGPYHPYRR